MYNKTLSIFITILNNNRLFKKANPTCQNVSCNFQKKRSYVSYTYTTV